MCDQGSELVQVKLFRQSKGGRTHAGVDPCIAVLIQTLNQGGFQTVASCCGHGKRPGMISLDDGRELIICPDYDSARMIEKLYPGSHEEDVESPTPMNVDDYAKLVNTLEEENAELMKDRDSLKAYWHSGKLTTWDQVLKKLNNLEEENAELVKKRDIDQTKMEGQWLKIQEAEKENKALETELKLQEKDNERIIQLSKIVHESMKKDRDGQTAGWDASAKVVDSLVKEIMELTKTIDILRDGHTHDELSTIEDYKTEIIKLEKTLACCQESENDLANQLKDTEVERDSLKVTVSALRTASKFKKEYDPKWQNSYDRVNDDLKQLKTEVFRLNKENADLKLGFHNMQTLHIGEKTEIEGLNKETERLNKDLKRIHEHWHRQTSGYMNKIKHQRRQLKQYQKCLDRLNERINTLYPYIVHGDMDHRKWLRKSIDDHFNMYKPDLKPKIGMTIKKIESETFSQGGHV